MALSQVQIIQSLAEALGWFEKELSWGVAPAQLGHLTGRIGELYTAMITRGQMAQATNQHGYDVVSADNERISVKTVTTSYTVPVRKSTIHLVDRIVILRITVHEGEASIEELLDCPVGDFPLHARETPTDFLYSARVRREPRIVEDLQVVAEKKHGEFAIRQYENGTIIILHNGVQEAQAKPILRQIAADLGISLLNANGNPRNTRQLGNEIVAHEAAERQENIEIQPITEEDVQTTAGG